jgi:hypothetical protein
LLFRTTDICLSGGSVSRRHNLSTSEFTLSKDLYFLGINPEEVFKSPQLKQDLSSKSTVISNSKLPKLFYNLLISFKIENNIKALQESKKKDRNKNLRV